MRTDFGFLDVVCRYDKTLPGVAFALVFGKTVCNNLNSFNGPLLFDVPFERVRINGCLVLACPVCYQLLNSGKGLGFFF